MVGCARYVYLDEQQAVAAGTGRCVFCAACAVSNDGAKTTSAHARHGTAEVSTPTAAPPAQCAAAAWRTDLRRLSPPQWCSTTPITCSASYITLHTGGLALCEPKGTACAAAASVHCLSPKPAVPAMIISGCKRRYERAAAVVRAAGFEPRWLPGVFPATKPLPDCWLSKAQQGNTLAHRKAWLEVISSNRSMAIFEDDVVFATTAQEVSLDIQRCNARKSCLLAFLGLYDNYWSTTALYLTPRGATQLISNSGGMHGNLREAQAARGASFWGVCKPPDTHTRNLCTAHSATAGLSDGRSAVLKPMKHGVCLEPRFRPSLEPRPAGVYGFGHFLQDKVKTAPLVHADNRREAMSDFLTHERDPCA